MRRRRRLEEAISGDWRLRRWVINEPLNGQKPGLSSLLADEMKDPVLHMDRPPPAHAAVCNFQRRRNLSSERGGDYLLPTRLIHRYSVFTV